MKTILALALLCLPLLASDTDLANALAAAGTAQVAKGNTEQAKDMFYRALAYDEACGEALYELARLAERDGDKALAGTLYARSVPNLKDATKRALAEAKTKILNPLAAKVTTSFDEYARGLENVVRRNADKVTFESATQRIGTNELARFLAADKMPRIRMPVATVSFKESMGYVVAELKDGAISHVGEARAYQSVPRELIGMQYTKVVPYKESSVTVTFDGAGIVYILAERWSGYDADAAKLADLGAEKSSMAALNDGPTTYEIWQVSKPAGTTITIPHHALVAPSLRKIK